MIDALSDLSETPMRIATLVAARLGNKEGMDYDTVVDTYCAGTQFDHQRPIVLRDESSVRHCRLLLSHPMASPMDVQRILQVEMIAEKSEYPGPSLLDL